MRAQGVHCPVEISGVRIDFSRQLRSDETVSEILTQLDLLDFESQRKALFTGSIVNQTEGRAAWHTSLRSTGLSGAALNDLNQAKEFANSVRSGDWLIADKHLVKSVVVLGIGGSLLGPSLAVKALSVENSSNGLACHFVGNIDGQTLDETLSQCEASSTLFLLISKSFTTQETQLNAQACIQWLSSHGVIAPRRQFIAITADRGAAENWGARPDAILHFDHWVGGRYSLWSAVGLPIMLVHGVEKFEQLVSGASALDQHFFEASHERNLPVLLAAYEFAALKEGESARCIAVYDGRLRQLPDYLQQLEMESLGKTTTVLGGKVKFSSPLVWGTVGTSGQHSVFQWLHQAPQRTPIDFIVCARPNHAHVDQHQALLANCIAQSQALAQGRTLTETSEWLRQKGVAEEKIKELAPHMSFAGGRSSTLIMLDALTPFNLGALLAMYEHKVFVLSLLFGVNAFDQFGVELGKVLAKDVLQSLQDHSLINTTLDETTRAQLAWLQAK